MKPTRFAFLLFMCAVTVLPVSAEKANMGPVGLHKTATHVIVATLVRVYEHNQATKDWNYTYYVAEVRIKEIEKGAGLQKGELLYARYWTKRWVGTGHPSPGTSGHRGLPKDGETYRIYLARNAYDGFGETRDGGFNVLGANGFEKLKQGTNH